MKTKILFILFFMLGLLSAQENECHYKFTELVNPSIYGTYLLEDDIINARKFHTINWRININRNETHNYATYYCINNGSETIWGISSDDFAITKEEYIKWNTKNIQEGYFFDELNRKFIKISNESGLKYDAAIKESVKKILWEQIVNGVKIKPESGIKLTEYGLIYNKEKYELELASIWETSPSKTYLRHVDKNGKIDKVISVRYDDKVMIFSLEKILGPEERSITILGIEDLT